MIHAAWLFNTLDIFDNVENIDMIIVITHHSVMESMLNPIYENNPINYTDYRDKITEYMKLKYWVNGHTHYSTKQRYGHCMCISNCYGYPTISSYDDKLLIINL